MNGGASFVRVMCVYAFCVAALFSFPAAAYIDGALASQLFQVLIAGGLAVVLFLKHFWSNVRLFVQSRLLRRTPSKPGD